MALFETLKRGWNAFVGRDPTVLLEKGEWYGAGYYTRPDRMHFTKGNERSVVTAVYNRLAIDASMMDIVHCDLDQNGRFKDIRDSKLNYCLTTEANVDQTGRAFIQDICQSMFDEGVVAIMPVDTDVDPINTGSYDIETMRTGRIVEWYPAYVKIQAYDERYGIKREIMMPKSKVAIVENPFYAIMNEPNSTMQRLIRKLNQLDAVDEQIGYGKLDMIIQLPYAVKSNARRAQAEMRRKELEQQLNGSKYGIAYTDGTEKITQLNRPVENHIMDEVEYLQELLFSQLGLTVAILNGTATPEEMQNYYTRTIEPIVTSIVEEMRRKFLTKTARTQGQSILFYRNPLKLVSVGQAAELADKFTRNEIVSSNEIRQSLGFKPIQDPLADQLRNKNLSPAAGQEFIDTNGERVAAVDKEGNKDNPIKEEMSK